MSRTHATASDSTSLIIDTDARRRSALGEWVAAAGFDPRSAESPDKARHELEDGDYELVLADPKALDREGRALFEKLSRGRVPVTASHAAIRDERARSKRPVLERFGRLIGRAPCMQSVYDQVLRVAPTQATVLLVGESGTGKELAAELIHGLSRRAKGPFVAVNCGALAPSLVESELFGHERGSFTGADRRRVGLFERARAGTLFLDEVTEMPLPLQVKLLRVLESGTVRRVGGGEPIDVDVRVIAATNRDPEEAVRAGALRADLLYRLLVFALEMPPLRERGGDVARIAQDHVDRLNDAGGSHKVLTADGLELLERHRWPGNVRELRNAVERAFILADGDLGERSFSLAHGERAARRNGDEVPGIRVGMTIREVERRMILATLERLGGDKTKTARTLGISLKTLYTRLSLYRAADANKA